MGEDQDTENSLEQEHDRNSDVKARLVCFVPEETHADPYTETAAKKAGCQERALRYPTLFPGSSILIDANNCKTADIYDDKICCENYHIDSFPPPQHILYEKETYVKF